MKAVVRIAAVLTMAMLAVGMLAGASFAAHTHVQEVGGDGACVILAASGGEKDVVLPAAAFNKNTADTVGGADHPIHVQVHRGKPGQQHGIWVQGSAGDLANCDSYVNG